MEKILAGIIDQLKSLEAGDAQDNIDGAISYLGCAVQNVRERIIYTGNPHELPRVGGQLDCDPAEFEE